MRLDYLRLRCSKEPLRPAPCDLPNHLAMDVRLPLHITTLVGITAANAKCFCGAPMLIATDEPTGPTPREGAFVK